MIVIYVLLALVLFAFLCLLLPLGVHLEFEQDFFCEVKLLGYTLYPQKRKENKSKSRDNKSAKAPKQKEKNLFEKLTDKRGFKGALKELFDFFMAALIPLKKFLKHIKFKNVKVGLSVVGSDAAQTAVDYGIVCSIVYPVLSLFESLSNVKYKSIDIRSDFEGKKSNFNFSLDVKASLIFILIFGYKIFKEYKNFCARNDL